MLTEHINTDRIKINDTDFLVIDVETTGLSPDEGDRVCEVGAVKLRGGAVVDSYGTLIDPQRPISAGAYAVNRISPSLLWGAPRFADVLPRLWAMMQGSVLVAYNAPFDLSFLYNEFRLAGHPPPSNEIVDALALARQLLPGLGRYPQDNVARAVGISFPVKHRAVEDALVTAKIFTLFTSILRAYDLASTKDLLRKDLKKILTTKRMSIVQDALRMRSNLWIKYFSPHNGEITDRLVTPKEISNENRWNDAEAYLIGYCHSAKSERSFRIERMLDVRMMRDL